MIKIEKSKVEVKPAEYDHEVMVTLPSSGRVFFLRSSNDIVGDIRCLFYITGSSAEIRSVYHYRTTPGVHGKDLATLLPSGSWLDFLTRPERLDILKALHDDLGDLIDIEDEKQQLHDDRKEEHTKQEKPAKGTK